MAIDDLLAKLAKNFTKPKLRTVFLINNYDMTIAILKVSISLLFFYSLQCTCIIILVRFLLQEAGAEGGKMQMHFEDLLKSNISIFVVHIQDLLN